MRRVENVLGGGHGGADASGAPEGCGDIDTFLLHVHRGTLEFVGYEVLPPVITHGPVRLDETGRAAALTQARARIADLLPV